MSSPAKRPAVTYQRGPRKLASISQSEDNDTSLPSSTGFKLNPDVALQQKINDLLFSKENNKVLIGQVVEEEFDSAYHDTIGNAKKVHDLVQVGETRRFIDEIEYLLDGLHASGPKSRQSILNSLEEIVGKCFKRDPKDGWSVNVAFGMKLKSHGALSTIFESLNGSDDPEIMNNLIYLISGLLYDVRRLDFFFKPELAIKLARHCCLTDENLVLDKAAISKLKCTQVFVNIDEEFNESEMFMYFGIWILFKWSFSSLTTKPTDTVNAKSEGDFFNLLMNQTDLLTKLIEICKCDCKEILSEKTASLLDCLINRNDLKAAAEDVKLKFRDLLKHLLKATDISVSHKKLAVSLSGSSIGKDISADSDEFFDIITQMMSLFSDADLKGTEDEILLLSCLINLIDRCEDYLLDEFRYRLIGNESKNLLQFLTCFYLKCPSEDKFAFHKSLLALILGFLCRQNRTNLEVVMSGCCDEEVKVIKKEIWSVASKFALQTNSEEIIKERLNEIVLTFK